MKLTKFPELKIINTPGSNLSVANYSAVRSKKLNLKLTNLNINIYLHKLTLQLQNITPKLVHYLIKHEEVLPHQIHDAHPILADYGTNFQYVSTTKVTMSL